MLEREILFLCVWRRRSYASCCSELSMSLSPASTTTTKEFGIKSEHQLRVQHQLPAVIKNSLRPCRRRRATFSRYFMSLVDGTVSQLNCFCFLEVDALGFYLDITSSQKVLLWCSRNFHEYAAQKWMQSLPFLLWSFVLNEDLVLVLYYCLHLLLGSSILRLVAQIRGIFNVLFLRHLAV